MAKGKFVNQIIEMAEKAGLDMSGAARMQRAKEQGFDVDRVLTHESPKDGVIEEIKPGGKFGGIFSLEDGRAGYYKNSQDFLVKGDIADNRALRDFANENYDSEISAIKKKYGVDDDEADEILDYIVTEDNLPLEGSDRWDRMSDVFSSADTADMYADIQKLRGELATRAGYGAVRTADEFGDSVLLLPGDKVRSVNAAFDPSKRESPNLLAGTIPAAVGLGSLLGGTEQAQAMPAPDFSARSAIEFAPQSQATIQAPTNNRAALAAALAGQYNQLRRERLHPLLDALLPLGELPDDLWRKRAYGDDVNMRDYINAGIGML